MSRQRFRDAVLFFIALFILLALAFSGKSRAGSDYSIPYDLRDASGEASFFDASVTSTGDPEADWILSMSLMVAHKSEPRNPVPKAMPEALARTFLRHTHDTTKLARLTYYSFAEGSYSLDPHLPGDCKKGGVRMPPGSPKCTPKLLDAGAPCCEVADATHWCTLQVQPMPKDLDECVSLALTYMDRSLESYTGSVALATKREILIQKLLLLVPPPMVGSP